jgi:hypothetical protein
VAAMVILPKIGIASQHVVWLRRFANFHRVLLCGTQSFKCARNQVALSGRSRGGDCLSSRYDDDLPIVNTA